MKWFIGILFLWSNLVHASLDQYKGKVVYLDFWASWCTPCLASFPWLNQMQEKYKDRGFTVVGVNLDKDKELADQFLAKQPAKFPIEFDPAGALPKQYGVEGMPYSVILDEEGKVVHRHIGFNAAKTEEYRRDIESALKRSGH